MSAYAVLGGADFGAGFWDLTAGGAERGARVRGHDQALDEPGLGGEPRLADLRPRRLLDRLPERLRPGDVDALRAAVHRHGRDHLPRRRVRAARRGGDDRSRRAASGATFALSSVDRPVLLRRHRRRDRRRRRQRAGRQPATRSAAGPTRLPLYVGVLAVACGAYLSAVFLAADAVRAGLPDLVAAFRRRALGAAAVTGLLAVGGIVVVHEEAPALYDGLTSGGGLVFVIGSGVAGAVTIGLVVTSRFGPARLTSALAVGAVIVGLAVAMRPDFLPGEMTLADAAAPDATLTALLIAFVVAALVLVPPSRPSTGLPCAAPSTPSSTRSAPPTPNRRSER